MARDEPTQNRIRAVILNISVPKCGCSVLVSSIKARYSLFCFSGYIQTTTGITEILRVYSEHRDDFTTDDSAIFSFHNMTKILL